MLSLSSPPHTMLQSDRHTCRVVGRGSIKRPSQPDRRSDEIWTDGDLLYVHRGVIYADEANMRTELEIPSLLDGVGICMRPKMAKGFCSGQKV